MTDAVYRPEEGRFVPTKKAGSPWGDDVQHGGPPAGLLARAIERFAGAPDMHVSRLTIDLFRPVPMAPVEVTARTVRAGRRIHVVEATLCADGVDVCRASGLLLRTTTEGGIRAGGAMASPPGPDGIDTSALGAGLRSPGPRREGFHTAVEFRRPPRTEETGPVVAWIRMPMPLVDGETVTPLVRIAATADFVNAIGSSGSSAGMGFINVDSTVYLHRPPAGEWIGMQVERSLEPDGVGVAAALLFDQHGLVGRATQAVLANRMT